MKFFTLILLIGVLMSGMSSLGEAACKDKNWVQCPFASGCSWRPNHFGENVRCRYIDEDFDVDSDSD